MSGGGAFGSGGLPQMFFTSGNKPPSGNAYPTLFPVNPIDSYARSNEAKPMKAWKAAEARKRMVEAATAMKGIRKGHEIPEDVLEQAFLTFQLKDTWESINNKIDEDYAEEFRCFLLGKHPANSDKGKVPWGRSRLRGDTIDAYLKSLCEAKVQFDFKCAQLKYMEPPDHIWNAWLYFAIWVKGLEVPPYAYLDDLTMFTMFNDNPADPNPPVQRMEHPSNHVDNPKEDVPIADLNPEIGDHAQRETRLSIEYDSESNPRYIGSSVDMIEGERTLRYGVESTRVRNEVEIDRVITDNPITTEHDESHAHPEPLPVQEPEGKISHEHGKRHQGGGTGGAPAKTGQPGGGSGGYQQAIDPRVMKETAEEIARSVSAVFGQNMREVATVLNENLNTGLRAIAEQNRGDIVGAANLMSTSTQQMANSIKDLTLSLTHNGKISAEQSEALSKAVGVIDKANNLASGVERHNQGQLTGQETEFIKTVQETNRQILALLERGGKDQIQQIQQLTGAIGLLEQTQRQAYSETNRTNEGINKTLAVLSSIQLPPSQITVAGPNIDGITQASIRTNETLEGVVTSLRQLDKTLQIQSAAIQALHNTQYQSIATQTPTQIAVDNSQVVGAINQLTSQLLAVERKNEAIHGEFLSRKAEKKAAIEEGIRRATASTRELTEARDLEIKARDEEFRKSITDKSAADIASIKEHYETSLTKIHSDYKGLLGEQQKQLESFNKELRERQAKESESLAEREGMRKKLGEIEAEREQTGQVLVDLHNKIDARNKEVQVLGEALRKKEADVSKKKKKLEKKVALIRYEFSPAEIAPPANVTYQLSPPAQKDESALVKREFVSDGLDLTAVERLRLPETEAGSVQYKPLAEKPNFERQVALAGEAYEAVDKARRLQIEQDRIKATQTAIVEYNSRRELVVNNALGEATNLDLIDSWTGLAMIKGATKEDLAEQTRELAKIETMKALSALEVEKAASEPTSNITTLNLSGIYAFLAIEGGASLYTENDINNGVAIPESNVVHLPDGRVVGIRLDLGPQDIFDAFTRATEIGLQSSAGIDTRGLCWTILKRIESYIPAIEQRGHVVPDEVKAALKTSIEAVALSTKTAIHSLLTASPTANKQEPGGNAAKVLRIESPSESLKREKGGDRKESYKKVTFKETLKEQRREALTKEQREARKELQESKRGVHADTGTFNLENIGFGGGVGMAF